MRSSFLALQHFCCHSCRSRAMQHFVARRAYPFTSAPSARRAPPSLEQGVSCSAEQPAPPVQSSKDVQAALQSCSASACASSAEQPFPSFASHPGNTPKRIIPDEIEEKQVKKRCSAEQPAPLVQSSRDVQAALQVCSASACANSAEQPVPRLVSVSDLVIPAILQPIRTALADEIDEFIFECEQWDPPDFDEEQVSSTDAPKFKLRNVYDRIELARQAQQASAPRQSRATYAVIKGLLALLHKEVDSSAWRASRKKRAEANDLYRKFVSHAALALDRATVELLALAVQHQPVAGMMDCPGLAARYLQYLADFAELKEL